MQNHKYFVGFVRTIVRSTPVVVVRHKVKKLYEKQGVTVVVNSACGNQEYSRLLETLPKADPTLFSRLTDRDVPLEQRTKVEKKYFADAINALRARRGLPPVEISEILLGAVEINSWVRRRLSVQTKRDYSKDGAARITKRFTFVDSALGVSWTSVNSLDTGIAAHLLGRDHRGSHRKPLTAIVDDTTGEPVPPPLPPLRR